MEYNSKIIFAVVAALIFSLAGIVMMTNGAQIDDRGDPTTPDLPGLDFPDDDDDGVPGSGTPEDDDGPVVVPFNHDGLLVNAGKHIPESLLMSESLLEGWAVKAGYPVVSQSTYQIIYEKDGVELAIGVFIEANVKECVKNHEAGVAASKSLPGFEYLDKCQSSFKCYIDSESVWGYAVQDLNVAIAIALKAADDTDYQELINSIIEEITENIHAAGEPFTHEGMYVSLDKYGAEDLMVSDSLLLGWTVEAGYPVVSQSEYQIIYEMDGVELAVGIFIYSDADSTGDYFLDGKNKSLEFGLEELDLCEQSFRCYMEKDDVWGYAVQDLNVLVVVGLNNANGADYEELILSIIADISQNIHDSAEFFILK